MHFSANLLAVLGSISTLASSFELTFREGSSGRCNGQVIGKDTYGSNKGCRTDHAGTAGSILIKGEGEVDDPNVVVLFSSDDCNPDRIITYGDQYKDENDFETTCLQGDNGETYSSFAVWNVLEIDS